MTKEQWTNHIQLLPVEYEVPRKYIKVFKDNERYLLVKYSHVPTNQEIEYVKIGFICSSQHAIEKEFVNGIKLNSDTEFISHCEEDFACYSFSGWKLNFYIVNGRAMKKSHFQKILFKKKVSDL